MNEPVPLLATFDPTRLMPSFDAVGSRVWWVARFVRGARESHV